MGLCYAYLLSISVDIENSERQSLLTPQSAAVDQIDIDFILLAKIGLKNGPALVVS